MMNPFEEIDKIVDSLDIHDDHDKQIARSAAAAGFNAGSNYQKEMLTFESVMCNKVKEGLSQGMNVLVKRDPDENHITIDFVKA